jgi:hypothetical protein
VLAICGAVASTQRSVDMLACLRGTLLSKGRIRRQADLSDAPSDDGHGVFQRYVETAMSFGTRRGRICMRIIPGELISPVSTAIVPARFSARRRVDR